MSDGRSKRAPAPAPAPESASLPARQVTCPSCRGPALFAPSNRWRPFCSERCRQADLGAWATERFRVAGAPADDEPTRGESA